MEINTSESKFIRDIFRKYMIASLIANAFMMAGQIVNNILLGQMLTSRALSVVSICSPIVFIYSTLAALFIVGGLLLCARYTGQQRTEDSDACFTSCIVLTALVCAVVSALLLLLRGVIVPVLCPDEALRAETSAYYTILALGGQGLGLGITVAVNALRQDGKPTACILVCVVSFVVSLGLCYLLIATKTMGVAAAAVATVAGDIVMGGLALLIIWRKGSSLHFVKVAPKKMFSYVKEILTLGSTAGIENASFMLRSLCINAILMVFGAASLASFGVIGSMISFHNVLVYGIGATALTFLGVLIAERDMASVRRVLLQVIKKGALVTLPITALCIIFSRQIAGFFGVTDPEHIKSTASAISIYAVCFFPGVLNYTITAVHMNNRQGGLADLLMVTRLFAYSVLFALLLKGPFGELGVWHSFWIAEVLTLVTALVLQLTIARRKPGLSPLTLLDQSAETAGQSISLPVPCTDAGIASASEQIRAFCEQNGVDARRTLYASLAAEEILLSLREHALDGNTSADIDVFSALRGDDLFLRFRSAGKMFDPIVYAKAHKDVRHAETGDDVAAITIAAALDACHEVKYSTTFGVNNLTVELMKE